MTHTLLFFSFSRACFRVVIAGAILIPDLATVHCGWRCDHASVAETHACMFIKTRMHDNSDTETVTRIRSKLKGPFTAVKSGSSISVGPSLNPHSLS